MSQTSENLAHLRDRLLAWTAAHGVPEADRQDLVQETLSILLRARFSEDAERPTTEDDVRYAFGILRRQRALLARRKLREQRLRRLPGVPREEDPVTNLEQQQRADALAAAVALLTSEDRQIILLRLKGASNDRIAAELGLTRQAVRQRWVRALEELRRSLFPSD